MTPILLLTAKDLIKNRVVGLDTGEATSPNLKIEVEIRNFAQLDEAITSKADIIMLDNMGYYCKLRLYKNKLVNQ